MSTVENNIDKFKCIICNKSYKDKSGLWYHNNKYHNKLLTIIPPNQLQIPPNQLQIPPNQLQIPPNQLQIPPNQHICKYCNKKFACGVLAPNHHINIYNNIYIMIISCQVHHISTIK
jgi:hypothetical protein